MAIAPLTLATHSASLGPRSSRFDVVSPLLLRNRSELYLAQGYGLYGHVHVMFWGVGWSTYGD